MKDSGAVIVSWDFSHGMDKNILLVGMKNKGKVDIINAFQGIEAYEIYRKLTTNKIRKE